MATRITRPVTILVFGTKPDTPWTSTFVMSSAVATIVISINTVTSRLSVYTLTGSEDADTAVQRLQALKDLGVRIAMDDFGTGYSSLSYLSRLPVDILKMDRAFLSGQIDDNGIAAAIMAIGERLGLEVVAEGIERPDQIDSLQTSASTSDRGSCSAGRCRRTRSTSTTRPRATRWSRSSRMQHSFEQLDPHGGYARVGLLRPLRHRDFRLLWQG